VPLVRWAATSVGLAVVAKGIGHDRAAVHRHVVPRHQSGCGALGDHLLEQETMQIAGAEATVPVL